MKKLLILISFYLLNYFNTTVYGQTVSKIDSLICQEWRLTYCESEGMKFIPPTYEESSRMIFYNDHKVKSTESDKFNYGIWKYNPTKKILTVTDDSTCVITKMKVIKLSLKELILELKDHEGILLKMHLEVIAKKK